jgi:hypothetical protein
MRRFFSCERLRHCRTLHERGLGLHRAIPARSHHLPVRLRSEPLTSRDPGIHGVFILVHGLERDGDNYFKSAISVPVKRASPATAGWMASRRRMFC